MDNPTLRAFSEQPSARWFEAPPLMPGSRLRVPQGPLVQALRSLDNLKRSP